MDTYWNTNFNCVKCGRCVKACHEDGEKYLTGKRDIPPDYYNSNIDYCPCHHCEGVWEGNAPCQRVCYYGAIEVERW